MSRTIRRFRRKPNGWVLARKITQAAALLVFLGGLILSRNSTSQELLIKDLVRVSPLAMLAELLSSKTFLAGSTLGLAVLLSSFFVGRAWCGWLCPLGTLLDVFHFSRGMKGKPLPEGLRKIKYGLLVLILTAALLGNLTFLFFDPVTIFIRSMTLAVLPALDKVVYFLETALVKVPFLTDPVLAFDAWLRPQVFPVESAVYQYAVLFGGLLLILLLLNFVAERFWCRYLCPLGALLGLGARLSLFQRRVNDHCTQCGLCASDCPTGTIDAEKEFGSDPAECTMCMRCLESCHQKAVTFTGKWQIAPRQEYDPGRRLFLGTAGLAVVMTVLFGVDWKGRQPRPRLLRPPGVEKNNAFLSTCVRCGLCMQVCPTQALQADLAESGLEGPGTPVLVPRIGYCSFSCNACGQTCPVGAIPPLSLKEKRLSKIGRAVIDHDRCLAWGQHENCLVCEEMCPLPQKAITLEKSGFSRTDLPGEELLLPVVNSDRCIGCGICENKCPVSGEAAIRVESIWS